LNPSSSNKESVKFFKETPRTRRRKRTTRKRTTRKDRIRKRASKRIDLQIDLDGDKLSYRFMIFSPTFASLSVDLAEQVS